MIVSRSQALHRPQAFGTARAPAFGVARAARPPEQTPAITLPVEDFFSFFLGVPNTMLALPQTYGTYPAKYARLLGVSEQAVKETLRQYMAQTAGLETLIQMEMQERKARHGQVDMNRLYQDIAEEVTQNDTGLAFKAALPACATQALLLQHPGLETFVANTFDELNTRLSRLSEWTGNDRRLWTPRELNDRLDTLVRLNGGRTLTLRPVRREEHAPILDGLAPEPDARAALQRYLGWD